MYRSYLLLVCLVFCFPAYATSPSVYVVNLQKVIDQSLAGKAAKANMQNELTKIKTKLDQTNNEILNEDKEIKKQASILAKEALAKRKDQLNKRKQEFSAMVKGEEANLGKMNSEAISKIVQGIKKIIDQEVKANSYDFVLEKEESFILYASPKIDISDQILAKYDAQYTKK